MLAGDQLPEAIPGAASELGSRAVVAQGLAPAPPGAEEIPEPVLGLGQPRLVVELPPPLPSLAVAGERLRIASPAPRVGLGELCLTEGDLGLKLLLTNSASTCPLVTRSPTLLIIRTSRSM